MDMQSILQSVSTVGFPILCAIAMGFFVKYITDKHREDDKELNKQHHEELMQINEQHHNEMKEVTQAINNNTIAVQVLTDHLTEWRNQNG